MSTPTASPVNRDLLSDQLYSLLRDRIVSGELQPGDRVVEFEIAKAMSVSQAPVREAVKRLVHEGLLVHVPRRGSHVAEIDPAEAEAARQVRAVVESLAAAAVAGRAAPEFLAELHRLVDSMRSAARRSDIGDFRDADIAFHRAVCEASDNGVLRRIWALMEPNLRMWRVVSDPLYGGDWGAMADLHLDLVEAIESGVPQRAAHAFGAHGRDLTAADHPELRV